MRYWFALIIVSATACAPNLTFDYDVFNEQAVPSVDEAPHPNNSLEWWYYTGLLQDTATMESFGVEFVVFHFNINGKKERLMTNVALTDVSNNEFHYSHTLGKLEDKIEATLPLNFEVKEKGKSVQLTGGLGNYTLATTAKDKDNDFGYKLNLNSQKEVLLHGDGTGYENYGDWAKAGYYSYTDLETKGTIWLNGKEHAVKGKMWYDRQWNCANVLSMRNAGWDWMSITLNETKEQLMLYRLRVNAEEHVYGGTLLHNDGSIEYLTQENIQMKELSYYDSPLSKDRYPTKLAISIPHKKIDLEVSAIMDQQELEIKILPFLKMHYWEGLCAVTGTSSGKPVNGISYLEITNPQNKKQP